VERGELLYFLYISFFLIIIIIIIIIVILFHLNSLGFFSLVSSLLSSEFVFFHSNGLRRASNHGSPSLCGHNNRPTHQQQLIAAAGQSEPTVLFSVFPTLRRRKRKKSCFFSFILELVDDICIILIATNKRKRSGNILFSYLFPSPLFSIKRCRVFICREKRQ
jgi:hypothetical protein